MQESSVTWTLPDASDKPRPLETKASQFLELLMSPAMWDSPKSKDACQQNIITGLTPFARFESMSTEHPIDTVPIESIVLETQVP